MENNSKGENALIFSDIISITGIIVTVIDIVVAIISIILTIKSEIQRSNRPLPKDDGCFFIEL